MTLRNITQAPGATRERRWSGAVSRTALPRVRQTLNALFAATLRLHRYRNLRGRLVSGALADTGDADCCHE